jgi:hypothetical protein
MKKVFILMLLTAIVASPVAVFAAPGKANPPKVIKTVPEPATMLLVGAAAAGLAGVRKLLRSKRQ